jgi:hypothetical protein
MKNNHIEKKNVMRKFFISLFLVLLTANLIAQHIETFDTEVSTRENGWTGIGNRTSPNNYGWADADIVLGTGTSGAVGGVIARAAAYSYFADTNIGIFDRTKTLHLSGSFRLENDNFDGSFFLGYFDHNNLPAPGAPINNFLGIQIDEPGANPDLFRSWARVYDNAVVGSDQINLSQNTTLTFDLLWTGSANGSGTLTGTLAGQPVNVTVGEGAGTFTAFGLLIRGISDTDLKTGNCYFDNLAYTKSQQTITQWNFNPFNSDLPTSKGTGTLNLIGGCTSSASTVANGSSDPASNNGALRLSDFPAQSTNSGTAGIELAVSTAGYENIKFSFDTRPQQRTSKYFQVQYSINNVDWINSDLITLTSANWHNNLMVDFSSVPEANNNSNFKVRVVAIFEPGKTTYTHVSGTSTYNGAPANFDMVTISGTPRDAEAVKVSITSVNSGSSVVMGQPFSVSIQALDSENSPAAVKTETLVTLSLATGTGNLGGTLSGTISAGSLTVTISGITYDKVEEGVSLTATASGLSSATSSTFNVVVPTYQLSLTQNIPGAGAQTGTGIYAEGAPVTVTATPKSGFSFINWTLNDSEVSISTSFTFPMPASPIVLKANYQLLSGTNLIHYWHFNNAAELSVPLASVNADFSSVGNASLIFATDGVMGVYNNNVLSPADLNAHMNASAGYNLRLGNPSTDKEVVLTCPSTGYEKLYFTFAASGVGSGSAKKINLFYSADNGGNWVKIIDTYELTTNYQLYSYDLSDINEVNNNEDLQFKINFDEAGTDGNQRLDNISLTGALMISTDVEFDSQEDVITLYPNPISDMVRIQSKAGSVVSIYNLAGMLLQSFHMHATTELVNIKEYPSGIYIVSSENGDVKSFVKFVKK